MINNFKTCLVYGRNVSLKLFFWGNHFNFNLCANLKEYFCQDYDEVSQNVHIHGQCCISLFGIHDYISCADRDSEEDIQETKTYVEHSLSLAGFKKPSAQEWLIGKSIS